MGTTVVRKHVLIHLQHYDKPSLLSGKLAAILCRSWSKGRDVYDLIWYLGDSNWPEPNIDHLVASVTQTGGDGEGITESNWRAMVGAKLEAMDWDVAHMS